MPPTDPWEEAAKNYKAQPQDTSAPTGNDDWKIWQQGGEQDDRNGFQKMVDSATQRHDPNYAQMGPLSRALDNFGRGAAGAMLSPIAHPLDAMNGAVNAISHPVDTAKGIAKSVKDEVQQNGAMSIPYALGQAGGALIGSEAGAPVAGAMKAAAPGMAEGALGISKVDRAFGKTPGRAILDETKGWRPASVERSAGERINQLDNDVESMAGNHSGQLDITPARDYVQGEMDKATRQNNLGGIKALEPVQGQLTRVLDTNQPLSAYQSARDVLELKRGLRNQFVKNSWNPDAGAMLQKDAARGASGVLDKQLDSALGPEFAKTNQRISSLIPVKDAAESVQRNAGMAQKIGGRMKAHTGALTGGIAGAAAGSHYGTLGALAGGIGGLVLPEAVASPTAQMGMARMLNSPVTGAIPKALAGSAGVVTQAKKKDE